MLLRKLRYLAAILLMIFSFGCRDAGHVDTVAVAGRVTLDGEPVDEAQVVFHPVDELLLLPHKPLGITDADGAFTLTTTKPGDGAPVGEYIVTIEKRELRQVGEEQVRAGKNLLPAAYSKPATSTLRYMVNPDDRRPAEFHLQRKRASS